MVWGDNPMLDTTETEYDFELKREAEERKFHRTAMVLDCLEMWQGSQNLHATQKESHAQNKQLTAVGYISDTHHIIEASWSNCEHDGAAAFQLSERTPLHPAFSPKALPGGRTPVLTIRRFRGIDCHSSESDQDSAAESISDTENWLNRNGPLDDPNESEED